MTQSGSQLEDNEEKKAKPIEKKDEYYYVGAKIPKTTYLDLEGANIVVLISLPHGLNGTLKELEKIANDEDLFISSLELLSNYQKELQKHLKKPFTVTFVLAAGGTQKALDLDQETLRQIFKNYNNKKDGDLIQYFHNQMIPYAKDQEDKVKKLFTDHVQSIIEKHSAKNILSTEFRIIGWEEACHEFKDDYPKAVKAFEQRYQDQQDQNDPSFRTEVNLTRDTYFGRNKEDKEQRINNIKTILSEECPEIYAQIKDCRSFVEDCGAGYLLRENAYFSCHRTKTIILYPKPSFDEGFKTIFRERRDYIEFRPLTFQTALSTEIHNDRSVAWGFPILVTEARKAIALKAKENNNSRAAHGFFEQKSSESTSRKRNMHPTPGTKEAIADLVKALTGSHPDDRKEFKKDVKELVSTWKKRGRSQPAPANKEEPTKPKTRSKTP